MSEINQNPEPQNTGESVEHQVIDNDRQVMVFANLTAVSISSEDAVLHFGVRRTDSPATADGVAKVYMTLPNFKRLTGVMNELLNMHEETFE